MQPVGRKWLNSVSPDAVPLAGSSARVGRQRSGRYVLVALTAAVAVVTAVLLILFAR
jgi:hypothetical protein